ncbi:MAG: FHA domain-containing protein [Chromatiaceae bacterium]|jgi:pSer/pThr/pTyr-binding forkhead associated (FHA) protein
MQAILKPISHPELGELVISESLFCVGRDDEAFAGLPHTRTGRLSRRHARLFEQDGVIYIVDLGSRNGTYVNGDPLATQPKALQSGDLIDFAGELTYRLDVLDARTRIAAEPSPTSTLHLKATAPGDGPDSLVITAFPFLVSKQADAFSRYQQRAPAELDYLSRRHAHIFRQDGRLFIEDLGSTNGTFVDGRRLGDESIELQAGQTVAFGGDYFVYRVVLEGEDTGTQVLAAAPTEQPHPDTSDKTTFVTAATSFLDIFCVDNVEPDTPNDPVPQARAGGSTAGRRPGVLERLGLTLAGRERAATRRATIASLLVAAALVAGGYWLLQPSPDDRMKALIEQQRFDEALTLARSSETGGDGSVLMNRLALRALISKTLPSWLDALDAGQFDDMKTIIDAERTPNEPLTAAGEYLDLLAVIGEIHATVAKRGGAEIPLQLFDEEPAQLGRLVEAWESPRPDKRQLTERLFAALPPAQAELTRRYEVAFRRAASHIRTLEGRLAVYRPAQQQIAGLLRNHLAQGTLDRLDEELDRLATRYGQLTGFEQLQQDLTRYRAILEAVQQDRETEAARLAANAQFHSPPFAEAATRLAQERLPSDSFLEAYAAALDLWRAGQIDAARDRLKPLLETPWKAIAQRELDRMGRVAAGFTEVQAGRGSDAHDDRLLDFFHALDGDLDLYFSQSLREDYLQSREQTTRRAQQAAAAAAVAWSSYQDQGGIDSTDRLESRIGKAYVERAGALSTAAAAAERAARAYTRAKSAIPEEQRLLLGAIAQEVALQHQSLDKLQGVLDDVALRQKRALLPRIASGKVQDEKSGESK